MEEYTKIASMRYLGRRQTYNLRMASSQHNYLTSPKVGQPVHANSHSCAYILVAYWCGWLKTHFAPEWWASVMSGCHADRVPTYMNTARLEGVKFGAIDVENITSAFSVDRNLQVTPGLTSIKGVGENSAARLEGRRSYTDIDNFIEINGKSKSIMEPLIKLGAFKRYHPNAYATWMWYKYRYCTGKDITALRKEIAGRLLALKWTPESIEVERQRQIDTFKTQCPRRKKIPNKILNWKPKVDDSRADVMALFQDDFTFVDVLGFEKQYLGYYWHSPLDIYETKPGLTIKAARGKDGIRCEVQGVIEKLEIGKTKTGSKMGRLHITDGLSKGMVIIWQDQLEVIGPYLKDGMGISLMVVYDQSRNSFTLAKNTIPIPLEVRPEYAGSQNEE